MPDRKNESFCKTMAEILKKYDRIPIGDWRVIYKRKPQAETAEKDTDGEWVAPTISSIGLVFATAITGIFFLIIRIYWGA